MTTIKARHTETFTIQAEAYITHADDFSVVHAFADKALPWRACVRIGGKMHWQWCRTKAEAIEWINKWKEVNR